MFLGLPFYFVRQNSEKRPQSSGRFEFPGAKNISKGIASSARAVEQIANSKHMAPMKVNSEVVNELLR
jgi:hypothetical protein